MIESLDLQRRFGGVTRLYGATGLAKLQAAHVMVVGIGGVGSWAAEALARNAVGTITLVDLDNIAESNFNRQLHAVDGNIGKAKITAMRERILSINPYCVVCEIEDFVTPQNIITLFDGPISGILDCIDDAAAKATIAAYCLSAQMPLVMAGGAGGRLDPTRIQLADLSQVNNDKLLAKVRNILRADYGFAKGSDNPKKTNKMQVQCVYSDELAVKPEVICDASELNAKEQAITGLSCAGYGSSVCVTAPMGFVAVSCLLQQLLA